jgi:hypothetical protein
MRQMLSVTGEIYEKTTKTSIIWQKNYRILLNKLEKPESGPHPDLIYPYRACKKTSVFCRLLII